MVRPDRDRLSGDVAVDESYVGGEEAGVARRQTQTKSIVAIAVERHRPPGFGRTRLRHMADCSADSLTPFVRDPVKAGSTVCADGWKAYDGLPQAGYQRYRQVLASSPDPAHVSMPGVHRMASLLKRWLLGTHQGSVGPEHLQAHLDESTFRFNRRNSRQRGLLFHRLLEQAVTAPPLTLHKLTQNESRRPQHVVAVQLTGYPLHTKRAGRIVAVTV
jgi:transposase-like protein